MNDKPSRDLFPGSLEMMILQTLRREPMHGYALAQTIQRASNDLLQVEEGSLYPALMRMLKAGWVSAEWGVSARNRGRPRARPRHRREHRHLRPARYDCLAHVAGAAGGSVVDRHSFGYRRQRRHQPQLSALRSVARSQPRVRRPCRRRYLGVEGQI